MKNYLPILVCYSLSVYTQMDTELDIPFTALSWQLPQGGAMVLCQDQDRRCWLYHIQFRWDSTIEVTDPWLPLYRFSFHIFKLTCIWTQILLILDNAVQSPNAILHFTPKPLSHPQLYCPGVSSLDFILTRFSLSLGTETNHLIKWQDLLRFSDGATRVLIIG